MNDKPTFFTPAPPIWSGFTANPETMVAIMRANVQRRREELVAQEENHISYYTDDLVTAAQMIESLRQDRETSPEDAHFLENRIAECRQQARETHRLRAASIARLAELRRNPPTTNELSAEEQLLAMRRLPGVLGIREEDNHIVVLIRTSTVRNNRVYYLGDFEITFGVRDYGSPYRLNCVASGLDLQGSCHHPYWSSNNCNCHSYSSSKHQAVCLPKLGNGFFCFGDRTGAIKRLLYSGDIAQALQVMIASMNRFNVNHGHYLVDNFLRLRLTRVLRDELLALKVQGYDIDLDEYATPDLVDESIIGRLALRRLVFGRNH